MKNFLKSSITIRRVTKPRYLRMFTFDVVIMSYVYGFIADVKLQFHEADDDDKENRDSVTCASAQRCASFFVKMGDQRKISKPPPSEFNFYSRYEFHF